MLNGCQARLDAPSETTLVGWLLVDAVVTRVISKVHVQEAFLCVIYSSLDLDLDASSALTVFSTLLGNI